MTTAVSLLDQIEQRIKSGRVTLPPFNEIAVKLQNITRDRDFEMKEVLDLIHADQALTTTVLRVANSPFYSGLTEVATVRTAVVRLGAQELVRIAIMATEKDKYRLASPDLEQYAKPLWRHAMGCALGAQWLARRLNYRELEDESFIGGLIHDVGKLLLMKVLDDIKQSGETEANISEALVHELLAATHTQQGYNLAKEWQLPEEYCTVVRDHHIEEIDTSDTLQLLVRLANHACNQLGIGLAHEPTRILSATEEAYYLGAKDILLAELQIMLEDSKSLAV